MNYSRRAKIERQLDGGVIRRREAGQALALVAVVLLTLTLAAGLAVDMGYLRYERRRAQMAADSAAIAGASCNATLNCTTTVSDEGTTSASYNGFAPNGAQTTVNVQPGPSSGPHARDPNYVEAIITRQTPVFFMKALGSAFSSYTITARAVATLQAGKSCVYTTAAFNLDGGLSSNCVVDVGSDLTVLNGDTPSHYLYTGSGTTYAGTLSNPFNVPTNPAPVHGGAVADPLPSLTNGSGPAQVPHPAMCGTDPKDGTPYTYCAGYYSGGLTIGNWDARFQPGTYVFGGPLVITGNGHVVSGTGVTFYMANGSAAYINYDPMTYAPTGFPNFVNNCSGTSNVQPAAVVQLSAPTDPANPYAGILLIQPTSNSNAANIMLNNGDTCQGSEPPAPGPGSNPITQAPTQTSYMWGVMDMPSASVTLDGLGLEADGYCSYVPTFTTVIANTLRIDGHVSMGVTDCSPNSPGSPAIYSYPFMIPDPLKDAVLVE